MSSIIQIRTVMMGLIIGAFDIVPGVSGGTIAFVLGIYETLIHSIAAIHPRLVTRFRQQGLKAVWQTINGSFLLSLGLGIAVSILSFARLIAFLLHHYPQVLSGFFLGLVSASALIIGKQLEFKKVTAFLCLALGLATGFYVATLSPLSAEPSTSYIFFSGCLGICAMILPGISGSFILMLLGMYGFIIQALLSVQLPIILTFSCGCLVGLLSFAKLLKWLFKHYKNSVFCLLTGLMLGSLYKVWPWKESLHSITNRHGQTLSLVEKNILPSHYAHLGLDPMLPWVVVMTLIGFMLVMGINRLATKHN